MQNGCRACSDIGWSDSRRLIVSSKSKVGMGCWKGKKSGRKGGRDSRKRILPGPPGTTQADGVDGLDVLVAQVQVLFRWSLWRSKCEMFSEAMVRSPGT